MTDSTRSTQARPGGCPLNPAVPLTIAAIALLAVNVALW